MGQAGRALEEGESGPYGDLAGRPLPGGLAVLFVPSLAALLARAEELKGGPLGEEQVALLRDVAQAVVSRADVAAAVAAERGYADVDPARAWESWQSVRAGGGP